MKKYHQIIWLFLFAFFVAVPFASAEITPEVDDAIAEVTRNYIDAFQDEHIFSYSYGFPDSVSELESGNILVNLPITLANNNGYNTEETVYFLFEKAGDQWQVVDTDLEEKVESIADLIPVDDNFSNSDSGVDDAVVAGSVLGLGLLFLIPFILAALIGIIGTIFWIWMLVDVIRRPNPDKALWVIIVLLFHVLGAIVYYFAERKKLIVSQNGAQSVAVPPPPPTATPPAPMP